MRVVVTRPEPDAAALAAKLVQLGHEPVLAPLLHIVTRADASIPAGPWQAVAVTSANAARALPREAGLEMVPCFAVGAQSRAACLAAGFKSVTAAGGDVAQLAAHMADVLTPGAGGVLYLSGAETAGDFQGTMTGAGFTVTRLILYDAVAASALPPGLAGADAVLLFSPRSARIWRRLTEGETAWSKCRHLCLSAKVAEALPSHYMAAIAREPTEAELLALLES